MKKFGIIIAAMTLSIAANAQDKTANQYENEGNEFVQAKRFKQALESYDQAYALKGDSLSPKTLFNAGLCAQKTSNFDKAISYFSKTESLSYKADESAYRIAQSLRAQKKTDEYLAQLQSGLEKYKSGKFATLMKKDLAKNYRDQALKLFNEGADVTKQFAANTANKEKMEELKDAAKAKFNEALPLADKALEVNPEDKGAMQIKESIAKQLANL